jgi:hypothetical protein
MNQSWFGIVWTFSADLLPQVVENLLVVKLVNFCLEEQIPDEQCPQPKEIINMLLR